MTIIAEVLIWTLIGYTTLASGYLFSITAGSWFYRPPGQAGHGLSHIAIVIPAHNEDPGIASTLHDLSACRYPADLRTVIVVADNCTDNTATLSRNLGAIVFERRDDSLRGKGHALDWLFKTQRDLLSRSDVLVVVDADNSVDPEFLVAIEGTFADASVLVAQARYTADNPSASWFAAFGFLGFAIANHVRPAGRCQLGGSAGLKGSGMAFRTALILETGWPSTSIAEDLEFGKYLGTRNIRVHYQSRAIVTSNLGTRLGQVAVQQERWEGGRLLATRRYLPRLLSAFLKKPSRLLADEVMDLLVPPLSVFAVLAASVAVIGMRSDAHFAWTTFTPAAVLLALVGTAIVQLRMPVGGIVRLAFAPAFLILKYVLLLGIALKPSKLGWRRTPRGKSGD